MANAENKSGEQKAAEAEVECFRKQLGPFVVAAEATRMAMLFTDAKQPDNSIIFANDSFLILSGYEREEVLGRGFSFLMAQGTDTEALARLEAAFERSPDDDSEFRYQRRDGTVFWATILISPVSDESGNVVQHFVSFADITKQRQESDHLRFLLDELNHRTQNTLATVQAIAVQTLRGMADETVIGDFEGRVLALSKAHSLLGRENWEGIGLNDVIDQILQPFGLNDLRRDRFSVGGDDVSLQPKAALTLAMVFHELAANAAKHGALSNGAAGHIDIAWRVQPIPRGQQMHLRWQERGGPPVAPSRRKGFGSRLIERGLAQDIDGEVRLDYDPAGVVCHICMPIPTGNGRISHG